MQPTGIADLATIAWIHGTVFEAFILYHAGAGILISWMNAIPDPTNVERAVEAIVSARASFIDRGTTVTARVDISAATIRLDWGRRTPRPSKRPIAELTASFGVCTDGTPRATGCLHLLSDRRVRIIMRRCTTGLLDARSGNLIRQRALPARSTTINTLAFTRRQMGLREEATSQREEREERDDTAPDLRRCSVFFIAAHSL
ncbi:MAG TPA: hypothetical protein VFN67_23840 [Polyangiales bacterium]|nr:hypothetical protein [Polyangiales bacterium]